MPKKGYKQTKEHKRKISEIKKIFTKEQEQQICNEYFSKEKPSTTTLAKKWGCTTMAIQGAIKREGFSLRTVSEANKNKKPWNKDLTKETDIRVAKMAKTKRGQPAWNKNIPCSEETKRKIRDGNKNKVISKETREKLSKKGKGKVRSKETKEKMSISALRRIQNHPGPFKNTIPELKMKEILNELNIPFDHQFRVMGINHIFDFYLLNTNILIEVDGDYWHGNPKKFSKLNRRQEKIQQKDKENERLAKENNYILLRFWQDDILHNENIVIDELRRNS